MDRGDPARLAPLRDRRILLGIGGGIAAYKMASVASSLTQAGAVVSVAMTDAAQRFVTALTFESIVASPVYCDPWAPLDRADPQHVRVARAADLLLIAPCTMDLLARLAGGHASDAVTLLAAVVDRSRQPVLLAPSMNEVMWRQPATQRNLRLLGEDGFSIVPPDEGWHACRTGGPGRLPEPEALVDAILAALPPR